MYTFSNAHFKSPDSEVLVKCEEESEHCPYKPTLTEPLLSFVGNPSDFLYIQVYMLKLFLCLSIEIYININEIIFYNLSLLLNNLLLTSFVVSTC